MKRFVRAVLALSLYTLPATVQAAGLTGETNFGFTNFGSATNLGTNVPVVQTVAMFINILLSFLGVLAVVAIVIGGFRVMTSGGNEEQTAGGKKIMSAGLIGLIIIFVAYALAYFIVTQLANTTGARA
jgi:hypothetical protein